MNYRSEEGTNGRYVSILEKKLKMVKIFPPFLCPWRGTGTNLSKTEDAFLSPGPSHLPEKVIFVYLLPET